MACIDKCYLHRGEYKELLAWVEGKTYHTPRGQKIVVKDYIHKYRDEDLDGRDGEFPVMNSPLHLDNWLWHNCPLPFIRAWLEDRYCDEGYRKGNKSDITSEMTLPNYEPSTKISLVHKGAIAGRRPLPLRRDNKVFHPRWFVEIDDEDDYWWYNEHLRRFVSSKEYEESDSSHMYGRRTIRAVIRALRRMRLPKGLTIKVTGRYVDEDWTFKTK